MSTRVHAYLMRVTQNAIIAYKLMLVMCIGSFDC